MFFVYLNKVVIFKLSAIIAIGWDFLRYNWFLNIIFFYFFNLSCCINLPATSTLLLANKYNNAKRKKNILLFGSYFHYTMSYFGINQTTTLGNKVWEGHAGRETLWKYLVVSTRPWQIPLCLVYCVINRNFCLINCVTINLIPHFHYEAVATKWIITVKPTKRNSSIIPRYPYYIDAFSIGWEKCQHIDKMQFTVFRNKFVSYSILLWWGYLMKLNAS